MVKTSKQSKDGLSELDWLVRNYCCILWKIEKGNFLLEDARQNAHRDIADFLNCDREVISPVLHNINYNKNDGYLFLEASATLKRLSETGLLA